MYSYGITFGAPDYLWLIALIPVVWWSSFKSLAGLGKFRRALALAMRTVVMLLIIVALAEIQWKRISEALTVIYVLDQSESIPQPQREEMLGYVARDVAKNRRAERGDRAGIIAFGGDATIEIPPFADDIPSLDQIESYLQRRDATNLEGALKLAQASFPEDTAKRIVVVTDGNENLGDAQSIANVLAENGIGIDVKPIQLTRMNEVSVEKISLPSQIRVGQTFEARVVLNNDTSPTAPNGGKISGKLKVFRDIKGQQVLISEEQLDLAPGKRVFRLTQTPERADMYSFRAVFEPDEENDDRMTENNEAVGFSHVYGKGRILMIVDAADREKGTYDEFLDRMRDQKLEIELQGTDELFTSLRDLQPYDCVILANVARSSGDDLTNTVNQFSDQQISALVKNTHDMSAGLIMFGGPNSFGAGGWSNTELEKAMPVDFQINNDKVQAVGALVLLMHASEMAQGNYWQKVVAREAIKTLGPMDYCGLLHWNDSTGIDDWLWGGSKGLIRVGTRRNKMIAAANRMRPGDMPQFDPGLRKALAGFNRVNASVKHMIVISDGDPSAPSPVLLQQYVAGKIKVSTVAVGSHGMLGSTRLQDIATKTGGKYYEVKSAKALPKIYQQEARRVARPLVFEPAGGIQPKMVQLHEMHQTPFELPPLSGFVLTTKKQNSLAEVSIVSTRPASSDNSTVLAAWSYGSGRTVAFTSDVTTRWANEWQSWPDYDKFFSQMILWAMRPIHDEGEFNLTTTAKDGKVNVILTAFDKNKELWNFLNVTGVVVAPDLTTRDITIRQNAAGRYVGEFDADQSGNYFISVSPGPRHKSLRAGVSISYSAEFRDRETNRILLETLAGITPKGGEQGAIIVGDLSAPTEHDPYRHNLPKANSLQDVWPLFLLVCGCVFFADVFVRRVTLSFEWLQPVRDWVSAKILRRDVPERTDERLDRLRNIKTKTTNELDERRASARFEPEPDELPPNVEPVVPTNTAENAADKPASQEPAQQSQEEDDYTARLLRAKKKAWEEDQQD